MRSMFRFGIASGIVAGVLAGMTVGAEEKEAKKDDVAVKVITASAALAGGDKDGNVSIVTTTNGNDIVKTITIKLDGAAAGAVTNDDEDASAVNIQLDDISKLIDEEMKEANEHIAQAMKTMSSTSSGLPGISVNLQNPGSGAMSIVPGMQVLNIGNIKMSQIEDKGDHYEMTVSGVDADESDVDVSVKGQQLNVKYKGSSSKKNDSSGASVSSFVSSSVMQSVTLPGPVKADQIKTEQKDGKLVVTVPKE